MGKKEMIMVWLIWDAKQSIHDFLESYIMILPSLVKEEELQMSN